MIVTEFTRRALAFRRERRDLEAAGWRISEADQWEIHRGWRYGEVIAEVKISVCGKYVYTKTGSPPVSPNT